jgi:hypothetical protein
MQRNLKGENREREREGERRDLQMRHFSPFLVVAIFSTSRSGNITSIILLVKC